VFKTLKTHLLLLGLLISLPAVALLYILSDQYRAEVTENAGDDALRIVSQLAAQQKTLIESTRQILATAIQVPEARLQDLDECTKFFKKLDASLEERQDWKNFGGFIRTDSKGNIDCASSPKAVGKNVFDRAYFKKVMSTGSFAMSDLVFGRGKPIPILVLAQPIKDASDVINGALLLVVRTTWLIAALADHSLAEGTTVTLLDSKGKIFGRYPENGEVVGTAIADHPILEVMADKKDGVLSDIRGFDNVPSLAAFHVLPGTTVRIVLAIPLDQINAKANRVFARSMLGLSLLVVLTLALAWWGGNKLILSKVHRLTEAANRLRAGETNIRSGLENETTEFGLLGRAFDDMTDEMNKRVVERTAELSEEVLMRRHVEGQLRKLSSAVEQSPNVIFITDVDGIIEYVNPKFTQVTGFSMAEACGKTPRILKSGDTPREVYPQLWNTILSGKEWRGELKDRCKDGTLFWASASITPVRDEGDRITHFVSMHEDITHRKETEARIRRAKDQAEIANRAKSDLMANMSHELRTPLNAIIGFSDTMRGELFGPIGNDQYREYLDDIHFSGEHLLELINDILDVSAIEAGALELQEENVVIANIVDSSIRIIRPRSDKGKVTITSSVSTELPEIYVDERRVKQVMLNLLSNAVKFTPEGGEISVSAWMNENGGLSIAVSDTGIGMDEEELATALRTFGQVDSGLDRKHEGTGLGLPLTMGLMKMHGGTLELKSTKGQGTMTTVILPPDRIKATCV
jgi:PAS domain S-box-containing protein